MWLEWAVKYQNLKPCMTCNVERIEKNWYSVIKIAWSYRMTKEKMYEQYTTFIAKEKKTENWQIIENKK